MLAGSWSLLHQPIASVSRHRLRWYRLAKVLPTRAAGSRSHSWILGHHPHYAPTNQPILSDYLSNAFTSGPAISHTTQFSEGLLLQLVRQGQYDAADELRQAGPSPPTDLRPHQAYAAAAEHVLSKVVTSAGKHSDRDVDAFVFWLLLVPDFRDMRPDGLKGLLDYMRANPSACVPFVTNFATVAASKGFGALASEAASLAVGHVKPSVHAKLLQDIANSIAHLKHAHEEPPRPPNPAVFEEQNDEYDVVLTQSIPPPSSTLAQIEESLPRILPEPSIDNASIFEDASHAEYDLTGAFTEAPLVLTDVLLQMLQDKNYDDAYDMVHELRDLGVEIPHSLLYLEPAAALLRSHLSSSSFSAERISTELNTWLPLLPPAHIIKHLPFSDVTNHHTFTEFFRLLFSMQITHLPLVSQSVITLASKGYADLLMYPCISFITRFASPRVTRQFLSDFEAAIATYWTSHKPHHLDYMVKRSTTNLRSLAVRSLAKAGRLEEALEMLPTSSQDQFHLTTHTYRFLRSMLQRNPARFAATIVKVEELMQNTMLSHPTPFQPQSASTSELDTLELFHHPVHLLRHLKRRITQMGNSSDLQLLLTFMQEYLASGRKRALLILRNRALRAGHKSAGLFNLAEMIYYDRQGLHPLVIRTYADQFFLSGVPEQNVVAVCDRQRKLSQIGVPTPQRFYADTQALPPLGKSWPNPIHSSLVWRSLQAMTKTDHGIERLYRKLLKVAKYGHTYESRALSSTYTPLVPPPSWKSKVSASAFTPFLRRLIRIYGLDRSGTMLQDMLQCGIRPNVYHFTEVLGTYARCGRVEQALLILDKMEAAFASSQQDELDFQIMDTAVDDRNSDVIPSPDLVTYTSVLRGFIISRSLGAAEEVERRIFDQFNVAPGDDDYLDMALADLNTLRTEMNAADEPITSDY
ncbi:hypothetical protein BDN72DRAFT_893863 [Pluteus cervinus]|uniref:Uncharacterized protein n=1 Tax=Pluteus cervinus TaxID=181527 RepID=A0ACD3B551_9AGAR|nr:hypothetical protein BDN72DRAFT_893863 [Pluteus cervinus]